MPTTVKGLMFVPRARPLAGLSGDGRFQLTLPLLDRIAPGRTEIWLAHWTGEAAQAWWAQHQAEITPGTPLHVELSAPRCHFCRNSRTPEIHARIESIEFAPRHQS